MSEGLWDLAYFLKKNVVVVVVFVVVNNAFVEFVAFVKFLVVDVDQC